MKKIKVKQEIGLHEIKNKKRLCAVRDRKKGVRLKRVTRRKAKAAASLLLVGAVAIGFAFSGGVPSTSGLEVNSAPTYELTGGTPDQYTGIENIGRMNYRLQQQTSWYSEMHSNVETIMSQTVDTYKQYSNGIMIQLDISKSALINEAQQFCWIPDSGATLGDVYWRTTNSNSSTWTGVDMPWYDGSYSLRHETIYDFQFAKGSSKGFAGTQFSVYYFADELNGEESTIESAEDVILNEDGTYSQTFHLRVQSTTEEYDNSAVCNYRNQMVFKGGLGDLPPFEYVTVTYTFDATWLPLKCEVEEKYTALKAGIPVPAECVSNSITVYEYNTDKANHTAFDEFFKDHLDSPITGGDTEKEIGAVECLGAAFGSMLTEPTTLSLSLNIDGYTLSGLVRLDLNSMDVRAEIQNGAIRVWYENNVAYLTYGGLKIKLSVNELLSLFGGSSAESTAEAAEGEGGFSLDGILADLTEGKFTREGNKAYLSTFLDLSGLINGLQIPELTFTFDIDENNIVSLDEVKANIAFGDMTLGATMSFSDEELPVLGDVEKNGYTDFTPYVESVLKLAQEDVIGATVFGEWGNFLLEGDIRLSYRNEISLTGELTLARFYRETFTHKSMTLAFAYLGGRIYLDLDGVRVSANAEETVALVKELIGGISEKTDEEPDEKIGIASVLDILFSDEFMASLSLAETDGTVRLSVKITQILELLGMAASDSLENAALEISKEGKITLSAIGATIIVEKSERKDFPTDGYTDILPYITELKELFTGEALKITLDYTSGDLAINGTVAINLGGEILVKGDLAIIYDGASIPVSVIYIDGNIYLNAYGMKVMADAQTLFGLVSGFGNEQDAETLVSVIKTLVRTESPSAELIGISVTQILNELLNYNMTDLLNLSETDGVMRLEVNGTNLLKLLFGSEAVLGNATITVQKGALGVSILGANIEMTKGAAVAIEDDLKAYTDVTALVAEVGTILENGSLAINGSFELLAGDTRVTVSVEEGVLSWKNGFELYLNIIIGIDGVQQRVIFRSDKTTLKFVYGNVGASIDYTEFDTLDEAFVRLYQTVKSVLDEAFKQNSPMPEIESITDLFAVLEGLFKVKQSVSLTEIEAVESFSFGKLLSEVIVSASDLENGISKISYKDLVAELFLADNGGLGIQVGYITGNLSVSANLEAGALERPVPAMPDNVNYLTASDFAVMLDYVGAAVQTLAQPDLSVQIKADILGAEGNVVTAVNGSVLYHTGTDALFEIDTENTTLTVTTNLYLNVSLKVISEEGNNLYFDLLIFDYNQDKTLDFFVTLSMYESSDEANYKPLKIYAPASEIMTVLSAGISVFGINADFLNDYLVQHWLEAETTEQLLAFGSMLKKSLGFDKIMQSLFAEEETGTDELRDAFIRSVQAGDEQFRVVLNSSAVYGADNLKDIEFTVTKQDGVLTGISLLHLYNQGASQETNVTVGISTEKLAEDAMTKPVSLEGYFDVTGLGALLKTLANTATHDEVVISGEEQVRQYVVNKNFYIDGSAKATIMGIGATIKVIAVSVNLDEDGEVGVNIRLEYSGVAMGVVAIKGDSQVDLTIKGGMVYMKRVQTSEQGALSNKQLSPQNYITTYRAMPLNVFFADILQQLGFILNLGDTIVSALPTEMNPLEISGDYGARFNTFVSGFSFAETDKGSYTEQAWKIVLNGGALTGGVMSDISIDLMTDETECIRDLKVNTGVVVTGSLEMAITANLKLRNPKGVMEDGVKDLTEDIANTLGKAMGKAITEAELRAWKDENGKYIYIEGVLTNVFFVLGDEELYRQSVLYNGKTFELYAELDYPDFNDPKYAIYQMDGYTLEWEKPEGNITPNQVIYAYYHANRYTVTIESEREIDGFVWDGVKNCFRLETEYVYGDGLYYEDGNGNRVKFGFPQVDEQGLGIGYYEDENGNRFTSFADFGTLYSDATLTAVWTMNNYTVTYEANGKTFTQTANYGENYVCAIDPAREGYSYSWQDEAGNTVDLFNDRITGSVKLTAVYTPETYRIMLVSANEIAGFVYDETLGAWTAAVSYTYGEKVVLPNGEKVNGYHLDGFALTLGGDFFTSIPLLTEDTVLYAVWSEIGITVTFVGENDNGDRVEQTRNYKVGAALGNLPDVPVRTGYIGKWIVPKDFTVPAEDVTIFAQYDPVTYTVSIFSDFELSGYHVCGDRFVLTYEYTYSVSQRFRLDTANMKVPKYDFGGYYTEAEGRGTEITEVSDAVLAEYAVGSTLTLYVYHKDNTVTVTLWSDYMFTYGSAYAEKVSRPVGNGKVTNSYRFEVSFNDIYELGGIASAGYQQLGWWVDANGEWTMISDVREYDGAEIWALWIQELQVVIDNLYTNSYMGGVRYNLEGQLIGGAVSGNKSTEIAAAVGLKDTTEVKFVLYDANGQKEDKLDAENFDRSSEDGITRFEIKNQDCYNYAGGWGRPRATFGGAIITISYSYNGKTVKTESGSVTSVDSFNVKFINGDGTTTEIEVKTCPYLDYGVKVYADEIAPELFLKEGYTGCWEHTLVYGGETFEPVYIANLYSVRFVSDSAVNGWSYDAEYDRYYIDTMMRYGASVEIETEDGKITDTVSSDGKEYVLPAIGADRKWVWNIAELKSTFVAKEISDEIVYTSAVGFAYNGADYTTYKTTFSSDYTLLSSSEISANGYTFLGWYMRTQDGGWQKVEVLSYFGGDEEITYTVEALWVSDLTVDFTNAVRTQYTKKVLGITTTDHYGYTAEVRVLGGKLIGAFAENVNVESMSFNYYLTDESDKKSVNLNSYTCTEYCESNTLAEVSKSDKRARIHAEVSITYVAEGFSYTVQTAHNASTMETVTSAI